MKILVTGASGNVGRDVVENLMNSENQIVIAGTDLNKLNTMYGEGLEKVKLDFTDSSTFKNACKNVDRIFLMRPPHLGNPEDLYAFVDFAKTLPIKMIVFLSLMGIEKNSIPPHYKIEKYIEKSGIPYSHIRPSFFMQNLTGIHLKEIIEDKQIFIPAARSKTSFIDAFDVGLAVATVLKNPIIHKNTAYTITGPKAMDYFEVARILSKVTKKNISYANVGFLKYRNHYINKRNLDKKYVYVTMALYLMTRMGTAQKITGEFSKLTGQEARNLEEFFIENKDAFFL